MRKHGIDEICGLFLLSHESFPLLCRLPVAIGAVAAVDAGEHSLQTVVFTLGNRIELVVVAAGAMSRQTQEG